PSLKICLRHIGTLVFSDVHFSLDNHLLYLRHCRRMKLISTRQAARRLGLHPATLAHYLASGKLPMPTVLKVGTASLHAWTDAEIENVRKLLPKIANGRKTRHRKAKAQARVPVPHKSRKSKKK